MLKKVLIYIVLISLFVLVGCSKKEKRDANLSNGEFHYEKETIVIETDNNSIAEYHFDSRAENLLYLVKGDKYDYICKVSIADKSLTEEYIKSEGTVVGFDIDDKNLITLIILKAENVEIQEYIDGKESVLIPIDRKIFDGSYPFELSKLDDESYIMLTNEAVYHISKDGELIRKMDGKGKSFRRLMLSFDGTLYITYREGINSYVSVYDYKKDIMADGTQVELCTDYVAMDEGKCMLSDGRKLFSFDKNGQTVEEVYDFSVHYIKRDYFREFKIVDNKIYILSVDDSTKENGTKIIVLTPSNKPLDKRPEYDSEGKRIVYIYSRYSNKLLNELYGDEIVDFNLENPLYSVKILEEKGTIDALISSDNSPDILWEVYYTNIEEYMQKGYLADLRPYIDESERVDLSNIDERAYINFASNGGIYAIINSISASGLSVRKSDFTNKDTWTVSEFLDWIEKHPDVRMPQNVLSKEYLLDVCLKGCLTEYVDIDSGKVNFLNDEFCNMLSRIASIELLHEEEQPFMYSDDNFIENKKDITILDGGTSSSLVEMVIEDAYYGDKMVNMGYPNNMGIQKNLFDSKNCFCILDNSTCKEGAYEFLEYLALMHMSDSDGLEMGCSYANKDDTEISTNLAMKEKVWNVDGVDLNIKVQEENVYRREAMFNHAEFDSYILKEIREIVKEEFAQFCEGKIDVENVAKVAQSRSQLLIDEKR